SSPLRTVRVDLEVGHAFALRLCRHGSGGERAWGKVVVETLVPSFSWEKDYIVAIVAVLGTTISPYLFFWQASEEAEDEHEKPGAQPLTVAPKQAPAEMHRIRLDTYVGMGFSNLIGL